MNDYLDKHLLDVRYKMGVCVTLMIVFTVASVVGLIISKTIMLLACFSVAICMGVCVSYLIGTLIGTRNIATYILHRLMESNM
jgi:hypothetical protein